MWNCYHRAFFTIMPTNNNIEAKLKRLLNGAIEHPLCTVLLRLMPSALGNHFQAMQSANESTFAAPGSTEKPYRMKKGRPCRPSSAKPPAKFLVSRLIHRFYLRTFQMACNHCKPSIGAVFPALSHTFPCAEALAPSHTVQVCA